MTISGDKEKVLELVEKLSDEGVFAKAVNSCGVAFHSPSLATVGPQLESCLKPIIPSPKPRSKGGFLETLIDLPAWFLCDV